MAKRKSTTKKEAKKQEELPAEKQFILCNGNSIKSIKELGLMLDVISDDEFNHHVNEERNDFSNWVRDVFNEPELAASLAEAKDKKHSQIVLLKHAVSAKDRG